MQIDAAACAAASIVCTKFSINKKRYKHDDDTDYDPWSFHKFGQGFPFGNKPVVIVKSEALLYNTYYK